MRLYQLFPDFTKLSCFERVEFLRSYRAKRAKELEENIKNKKGSNRIALSDEEKALIKALGIKQKDLALLKEIL